MSFSVHRPKNGTLVPKTAQHFKRYGEALCFGFSYLFPRKTVRRTFMWYAAYAFKTDDRTVSKSTLYAFWYAVRFSVAIVVPFIAAYKVYKSYTCSIFGMGGCFWYAYTVFRMRPFNGTLYCISYACTVFGIASVFGTHTVFGT